MISSLLVPKPGFRILKITVGRFFLKILRPGLPFPQYELLYLLVIVSFRESRVQVKNTATQIGFHFSKFSHILFL